MKKQQYIQPETIVVFIKSTSILDGSNEYKGGNDLKFNPDNMDDDDGSDAASRRRNTVWDEE